MIVQAVDLAPGDVVVHHTTGDRFTLVQKSFASAAVTVRDDKGTLHTLGLQPTDLVNVPDGRILATVEDLDALPVGTVVVTDAGEFGRGIAYRKQATAGGTTWYMPRAVRTSARRLLDADHSAQPIRLLRAARGGTANENRRQD